MMTWLIYLLITLAAYAGMEFMAWFTHKYVMHGVLWSWWLRGGPCGSVFRHPD